MRKDKQATEAKHFICKKSFVDKQGREVLFQEDWLARVVELDKRSGGRCECIVDAGMDGAVIRVYKCGAEAVHPHHLNKRSKGRDDRLSNLLAVCATHHRAAHPEKQVRSDKAERVSGSI